MTTIGVSTYRHDNPKDMCVPSYSYQFPAGRRVQLVSVKEGIFHPRLPSIRQLDRDRVLHKLSDEHNRTSLPVESLVDGQSEEFGEYSLICVYSSVQLDLCIEYYRHISSTLQSYAWVKKACCAVHYGLNLKWFHLPCIKSNSWIRHHKALEVPLAHTSPACTRELQYDQPESNVDLIFTADIKRASTVDPAALRTRNMVCILQLTPRRVQ